MRAVPHPLGVRVTTINNGEAGARTINIRRIAGVIRSKNAGPFRLTLDILFKEHAVYERVKRSGAITPATIAGLYGLPPERVTDFVWFDPGKALKITLARPVGSGGIGDGDVYGAQQHAPLLGLELPSEILG
jgi:hypothetical protein